MAGYQPSLFELRQVVAQRCRGQAEAFSDRANRKPLRASLDKEPEDVETSILGKGRESCDDVHFIHISRDMEILRLVKHRNWTKSGGRS